MPPLVTVLSSPMGAVAPLPPNIGMKTQSTQNGIAVDVGIEALVPSFRTSPACDHEAECKRAEISLPARTGKSRQIVGNGEIQRTYCQCQVTNRASDDAGAICGDRQLENQTNTMREALRPGLSAVGDCCLRGALSPRRTGDTRFAAVSLCHLLCSMQNTTTKTTSILLL